MTRRFALMLCVVASLAGCISARQPYESGRIHHGPTEYATIVSLRVRAPAELAMIPDAFVLSGGLFDWLSLSIQGQWTIAVDAERDMQVGVEIDQTLIYLMLMMQFVPTIWVGARQAVLADDDAPSLLGARLMLRPKLVTCVFWCDSGMVDVVTGLELRYVQSAVAHEAHGVGSVFVRGEIYSFAGWGATPESPSGPYNRSGKRTALTAGGYLGGMVSEGNHRIFARANLAYMQSLRIGRFEPGWVQSGEVAYMQIAQPEPDTKD